MVRIRRRWRVLAAVLVVVAAVVGAGWPVVVNPQLDPVSTADAVVVLGGSDLDGRAEQGLKLVQSGVADQLVLSDPYNSEQTRTAKICHGRYPGVAVTCFAPEPSTTLGEAQQIRDLARARGWTSIVVVTSVYHVSRARWIISSCFGGRLTMTTPDDHPGLLEWAYQYVYQSAGYVKAELQTRC